MTEYVHDAPCPMSGTPHTHDVVLATPSESDGVQGEGLREALWSVHQMDHDGEEDETWCASCGVLWPCPTAKVLLAAPVAPEGLREVIEHHRRHLPEGCDASELIADLDQTLAEQPYQRLFAAPVAQDSPDPLREALHACVNELDRLWYLHGRPGATFEGKVGEPDQQVIARGRAALAGVAADSPDPLRELGLAWLAAIEHAAAAYEPDTGWVAADADERDQKAEEAYQRFRAAIERVSRDH